MIFQERLAHNRRRPPESLKKAPTLHADRFMRLFGDNRLNLVHSFPNYAPIY